MAVSAARTRSRASPTALSGRPTIRKFGRPLAICTCTSTGCASMPAKAKLFARAMAITHRRLLRKGYNLAGLLSTWKESSRFFEKKRRKKLLLLWAGGVETSTAQVNKVFLLLFVHKK
ncbi:MAG TPA: hypothetical protein VNC39_11265 [Acidocella sp.]|uniref:hypothetical protein n=1 Tax=Acidocella sp. TaxID=50710 RepID=UPI002B5BE179|nr:hypothetical protein [Acidocella sp.]HVE22547.1 hypothetical protein [Acidocella sp.]